MKHKWVTKGWSRDPDGKWIELGAIEGVIIDPSATPPEITTSDVAYKLNQIEGERDEMHRRLKAAIVAWDELKIERDRLRQGIIL